MTPSHWSYSEQKMTKELLSIANSLLVFTQDSLDGGNVEVGRFMFEYLIVMPRSDSCSALQHRLPAWLAAGIPAYSCLHKFGHQRWSKSHSSQLLQTSRQDQLHRGSRQRTLRRSHIDGSSPPFRMLLEMHDTCKSFTSKRMRPRGCRMYTKAVDVHQCFSLLS